MASNAKFCSQCASPLPEPNPPFCSQCGAAVTGQTIQTPPSPPPTQQTGSQLSRSSSDPQSSPLRGRSYGYPNLGGSTQPTPNSPDKDFTARIGPWIIAGLVGLYLLVGFMIVSEFFDALRTLFYILLVLNVLPTIVALLRRKHNTVAIFLVNLLLGWTFIGWVVALVWASSGDRDD